MRHKVLDKGHVEYIDHMGTDLTTVNAARVSFSKESFFEFDEEGETHLSERDARLIRFLAKHNHWTTFAHCMLSLRIKAPIFVRAQLGKHQVGLVMNEVSRRYVSDEPEFYVPQWRSKPEESIKQGSGDFYNGNDISELTESFLGVCEDSVSTYEYLLSKGIAPEQTRSVLPQSMYTEWWWTGSLYAFARVYHLRIDSHAQWETRQYAKAIGEIASKLFPVSWSYLTHQN